MGDFIKHILTGKDNATYDIGRVALLGGFVVICGAGFLNLFLAHPIDLVGLATALGGYVTACMLGIGAKSRTEPDP